MTPTRRELRAFEAAQQAQDAVSYHPAPAHDSAPAAPAHKAPATTAQPSELNAPEALRMGLRDAGDTHPESKSGERGAEARESFVPRAMAAPKYRRVPPVFDPRLREIADHLPAPVGLLDLDALDRNIADVVARANGTPIRVASKSLRTRGVLEHILEQPGIQGVLAFTLAEAIWLVEHGVRDVVLGYPTADRAALEQLAGDPNLRRHITLMVDDVEQLDLIPVSHARVPVRVAIDLDAAYLGIPGLRFGSMRSPIRTPEQAAAFARTIKARPGLQLVGMMIYEAQIAGIQDAGRTARDVGIRALRAASITELAARRGAVVEAVRAIEPGLEFVNGGGTGSIETTIAEEAVTEVAAGSCFFSPTLFDGYRGFRHEPAAFFGLDVVRKPSHDTVTVLGGGWVASGAPGLDRLPTPVAPEGLRYRADEGAGEVQTPLIGKAARGLVVGDRIWFRHAKAGELAERLSEFHVVSDGRIVDTWPTYRGEGQAFL